MTKLKKKKKKKKKNVIPQKKIRIEFNLGQNQS